nr:reverse transcriptase domain-containing protein [Tanacetum cinerariifolium]
MNTASSSGTGSLPSNTVLNPREDLKAITTRSGVTLAGPSDFPPPLPSKEVNQEPETITNQVTKNMVQPSTENIQPLVTQTQVPVEPVVAPNLKLTIPYPSRANKQKLRKKDDILALKFVEIFRNLHFELSFADALLLVDYVVDPRVLLILGRPFLRTGQVLIDVYGEELTIRVDDEVITFKVGQTSKYSYNDAKSINLIDVIDVACEEYLQEGGDFISEEIEACLTRKSIPPEIDDTDLDLEGDIRLLEELLNNDPSLSPLPLKEHNVEEIKPLSLLSMNHRNSSLRNNRLI